MPLVRSLSLGVLSPRRRDAGQVALDVGCEDRNTRRSELLGEYLQGSRLAGSRCARDEAVSVEHGDRDAYLHVRQRVAVHECPDLEHFTGEGVA